VSLSQLNRVGSESRWIVRTESRLLLVFCYRVHLERLMRFLMVSSCSLLLSLNAN
jgi:hypothetical protein